MKLKNKLPTISDSYMFIDFETRSMVDLKKHGITRYATDSSTSVIVFSYAINNGKVKTIYLPGKFSDLPEEVKKFNGHLVPYNYSFEYSIFKYCLKAPARSCYAKAEHYLDAMAIANRWGLAGSLDNVATALGVGEKLTAGKGLIQKYSKPNRKGELIEIPEDALADFAKYCEHDVRITREVFRTLPPLGEYEELTYRIDQEWNSEGIQVDITSAKRLIEKYNRDLATFRKMAVRLAGETETGTLTLTSNLAFKKFLKDKGFSVPNIQAKTLQKLAESLPTKGKTKEETQNLKAVREALELRTVIGATAPKKLFALADLQYNSRLFFFLQYYGGHTGRWAGRGMQLQNLPRNAVEPELYETILESFLAAKPKLLGYKETLTSLIRGLIIPDTGTKFLIGDLSSIEARITFWLAGCKKGLNDYYAGQDIYKNFAEELPLNHITDAKARRQIGKLAILGLGYGMGHSKFAEVLADNKVNDKKLANVTVKVYRKTYPEIPGLWNALERCFKLALVKGSAEYKTDQLTIKFVKSGMTLRVLLPSGREMSYFEPRVTANSISYIHSKYGRRHIWGGVLAENLVQAIARDVLVEMLHKLRYTTRLKPRLTEHDSIVATCPLGEEKKAFAIFEKIMNVSPDWGIGLPIASECFVSPRYGK